MDEHGSFSLSLLRASGSVEVAEAILGKLKDLSPDSTPPRRWINSSDS